MGTLYQTILAFIATYGIANLIAGYDGLFDIFLRLRSQSDLFKCSVCLSVWLAVPMCWLFGLGVQEYFVIVGSVVIIEGLR